VSLTADAEALSTRAGQTAFITAYMLVARLGMGVKVEAPNVRVIDLAAPLRRRHLNDALADLGTDLVPGALTVFADGEEFDEAFVLGATPAGPAAVRFVVSDFDADLERGLAPRPCTGDLPFGGLAAGAAAAAIALEAAIPRIETATGIRARSPRPAPGPPVRLRLRDHFPELGARRELGRVDAISGGAITHALAYCLLRVPGLAADVRVVEDQVLDITNVNRYSLMRASDDGLHKLDQLERSAAAGVQIAGEACLFTETTRAALEPLAHQVVVGVDDVEARWWVQNADPRWLAIGATNNHIAQLTVHTTGSPCAACLHPEVLPPQTIPTISFVSFWAGLLQACALISGSREARNTVVYPFALGGPSGITTFAPVARRDCAIGCAASAMLE
jgi:hypothetical protein